MSKTNGRVEFVNEKRQCAVSVEGHGEYATRHVSYEVKCYDCGKWFRGYGEYSVDANESGSQQGWICERCAN